MSAPDQERLRAELRAAAERSAGASIDLDTVLDESRRARRRRRNGIAGGATAVAALVAAIGLTGALSGIQGPVATTADAPAFDAPAPITESAPADGDREAADGDREAAVAPRDGVEAGELALGSLAQLNRCGEPAVPATDASASALRVEVDVAGVLVPGGGSTAEVTVVNSGDTAVEGALSATPSLAVVEEGGVVWVTNDAVSTAMEPIDLAPGESAQLTAAVEARVCSAHGGGRLPDALAPGEYGVSASVVFVPAGDASRALVLVSPLAPLTVE